MESDKWKGRDVAFSYKDGDRLVWLKLLTLDRVGVVSRISDVLASHGVNQRFGYFVTLNQ